MLIFIYVGIAAVAVLIICLIKAHEIWSDSERVSRGEAPKYNNPPVHDVIDWTRKK